MFNAYEFTFDNSDYPLLVIAESLKKAVYLLADDAYHVITMKRLADYDAKIIVQYDD